MDDNVLADAVHALQHVLQVQLSGGDWLKVEEQLTEFAGAASADDFRRLSRAVSTLDRIASRGVRRGASADNPPKEAVLGATPQSVRERINELVHSLNGFRRIGGAGPDAAQPAAG